MDDLTLIKEAALAAGAIGRKYFKQNPEVTIKGDTSPVTEADLAIDAFLKEYLLAARPDYGWLSEETEDDAARLVNKRIFIVDPIDGTRGFINGSDEWCICIAIVEDGNPLCGVLYQASVDCLYMAATGKGATKNGEVIQVADLHSPLQIGGPKPFFEVNEHYFSAPVTRTRHVPSLALRIAYVADGQIDGAFIKSNAHDWDIAAAMVILQEAGGQLTTAVGGKVPLGKAIPRHGPMLCASEKAMPFLSEVAAKAGLG